MRDQVVALKYKTDRMIAVSVPIPILKILRGAAVDDQIALGILIKATDDVEHRGFSAPGRAENGHKIAVPEFQ